MFRNPTTDLIVILVIVLLIFGPGKLPELGKALGDGMRELKKATSGSEDQSASSTTAAASTTATVAPPAPAPAAGVGPTVATRPCPSCAGAVPLGDKFCGHCGATLQPPAARSA